MQTQMKASITNGLPAYALGAGASQTMSSREIAELTGKRHSDVMRDIRVMLESLDVSQRKFASTYIDGQGKQRDCFMLDRYHTEVLVTGYDVKRRAAVIRRWYELETQQAKPVTALDAIEGIVAALREQDSRVAAVESRMDEIETKALDAPRDYYAVSGYASLRGIKIDTRKASRIGKKAASMSRDAGYHIGRTHSEAYGTVNTYHVDVLAEIFEEAT